MMTVKEVREYLKQFPESLPVAFAVPSGDYWRTILVFPCEQNAEVTNIAYTEYHRCHKTDEEGKEKVLLFS